MDKMLATWDYSAEHVIIWNIFNKNYMKLLLLINKTYQKNYVDQWIFLRKGY